MLKCRVIRLKDQRLIAEKCYEAVRFFDRLRGLMGRSGLAPGEAMLFPQCSSVHTCWMRFRIDVLFLRRSAKRANAWVVSSLREEVSPWRVWVGDLGAHAVLELGGGVIRANGIEAGDEVECIV
jgi:uncharacterized protein